MTIRRVTRQVSIAELAIGTYGAIQKSKELEAMLDIIATEQPHTIVEIGTRDGGTLYAICQAAPDDALIISMDTCWETYALNVQLDNSKEFRDEFCKPGQNVRFLHADSHNQTTFQYLKNYLAGDPIDFLFLDGDHSYKGVKNDWETYSPLVRDGGIVGFHDIVTHEDQSLGCHVDLLWKELKESGDYNLKEIICTDEEAYYETKVFRPIAYSLDWGGIGIVYISRGGE